MPDVSGSNFDTAFEDEGDVQECGNYKDTNFMSHTTKVPGGSGRERESDV